MEGNSGFYSKVNSFLLNTNSPSSRILQSSFDMALRSTHRKSASCCLVNGITNCLLLVARKALQASWKFIPWRVVVISTDGELLD